MGGTIYTPSPFSGQSLLAKAGNLGGYSGSGDFEVNVNDFFKVTWMSTWTGRNNLTVTVLKNCHIIGSFNNGSEHSVNNNYSAGQSFGFLGQYNSSINLTYFDSAEIVAYWRTAPLIIGGYPYLCIIDSGNKQSVYASAGTLTFNGITITITQPGSYTFSIKFNKACKLFTNTATSFNEIKSDSYVDLPANTAFSQTTTNYSTIRYAFF